MGSVGAVSQCVGTTPLHCCLSVRLRTNAFKSDTLCRWREGGGAKTGNSLPHAEANMQIQSAAINFKIICFARSVQLHNERLSGSSRLRSSSLNDLPYFSHSAFIHDILVLSVVHCCTLFQAIFITIGNWIPQKSRPWSKMCPRRRRKCKRPRRRPPRTRRDWDRWGTPQIWASGRCTR